jgi:hypothetical protein
VTCYLPIFDESRVADGSANPFLVYVALLVSLFGLARPDNPLVGVRSKSGLPPVVPLEWTSPGH